MNQRFSRRGLFAGSLAGVGAAAVGGAVPSFGVAAEARTASAFRYGLNTSTIRKQTRDLATQVDIAAAAGYDGIEPWIGDIEQYRGSGKPLKDMKKRCADLDLEVPSAIGFAEWIVDDPTRRAKGLEQAKRDMEMLAAIGGTHIAAPPVGATDGDEKLSLLAIAERYAKLLEVGRQVGVVPQVEVWGFSRNLSRLGEAVCVAVEAGDPDACLLPDVYHIYKGGSDFAGLKLLGPRAVHCFHVNDFPATPPREQLTDAHRVYPGDGVAPWQEILSTLHTNGISCMLSLELFNRDYWKQDAHTVARTGLQKCRQVVAKSLNNMDAAN